MELTYTEGNLTVTITGTIEDAIAVMGRSIGFTAHWHQPTPEPTRTGTATGWNAWIPSTDPATTTIHPIDCTCDLSRHRRIGWSHAGETLPWFFNRMARIPGAKNVTLSTC